MYIDRGDKEHPRVLVAVGVSGERWRPTLDVEGWSSVIAAMPPYEAFGLQVRAAMNALQRTRHITERGAALKLPTVVYSLNDAGRALTARSLLLQWWGLSGRAFFAVLGN